MDATTQADDKNPNIDAVIRKIQKLLTRTKGERGATEAEADAAMGIVQELMAKYNLDMATISAAGTGPDDSGSVRVKEEEQGKTRFKWQRELAKYVAEANFCLHLIRTEFVKDAEGHYVYTKNDRLQKRPVHSFIGRKANVITTKLMFDYLCQAIEDSLPDGQHHLSNYASSWKEGCSDRICERLASRRRDLMAEHDARVRAEQEAHEAELKRRAEEARKRAERTLGPRPPTAKEVTDALKAGAYNAVGMGGGEAPDPDERPEVNPDDEWKPGDNAAPEEELPPPVTALVLSSVYDEREMDENKDIRDGLPPGTHARWKRESEERWERYKANRAKEKAEEDEAAKAPEKPETERQKQARLRREAEEYAKSRRRWARQSAAEERREEREWAKKDSSAYRAGNEAGKNIGLDPQMKARTAAKRLGS